MSASLLVKRLTVTLSVIAEDVERGAGTIGRRRAPSNKLRRGGLP